MWHPMVAIFTSVTGLFRKRSLDARTHDSNPSIALLGLVDEEQDRAILAKVCDENNWELILTGRQEEARQALDRLHPQIILFDQDLAGDNWRELMNWFAASAGRACIMLISKVPDDRLWSDVVCHGGYEVLGKPLREYEVSRAIRLARSYWTSANKWAAGSARI